jgi:hypothetical protein
MLKTDCLESVKNMVYSFHLMLPAGKYSQYVFLYTFEQ